MGKNILKKEFRVLGRNKKTRVISDLMFLLFLAIVLSYYSLTIVSKLNFHPKAEIKKPIIKQETQTPTSTEKICLFPEIKTSLNYYNDFGDQIGIGPNPPAIGIPTNYWFKVEINTKEDDMQSINLYSIIPDSVSLTGEKNISDGDFQFIFTNRSLNWKIQSPQRNTSYKMELELSTVPDSANLGKLIDIVKNIKIQSKDLYCEKEFEKTIKDLSTDLKYDFFGKNKGLVREIK